MTGSAAGWARNGASSDAHPDLAPPPHPARLASAFPACVVCGRNDGKPQTCDGCVNRTRLDLNAILHGYALLPAALRTYPTRAGPAAGGSRDRETPLMGGDTLSLLAYGGDAPGEGQPSDPPSVLWELERWEADWRHVRGIPAATTPATISNTTDWLHASLTWAAQHHPAFDAFADDMRTLRARIDQANGTTDRPVLYDAECFDCGGRIGRHWTATGLADVWTCLACRRVYTDPEFWFAVRAAQENHAHQDADNG